MTLANLIIQYRQQHDMSQRGLAAKCGMSPGYIWLLEKEINPKTGKRIVPTLTILNGLAKGMGMTIDELLSVCDDMPVSINHYGKAALDSKSGIDAELINLVLSLPDNLKAEALHYLEYLSERKP